MNCIEVSPQVYQDTFIEPEPVKVDYNYDGCCNMLLAMIEDAKRNYPSWLKSDEFKFYRDLAEELL